MNTLRIGPLGARRAGTWQVLALCGVLITAGFLVAAFTAAGAEATRAGDFQFAAVPAGADPPACSGDGVYLYDDINYGGRCSKFTGSAATLADWNFDDLASSFKLAGSYGGGRYRVTLCENTGYAGACSSYLADDPWLGDDAIGNDRASSAKGVGYNMRPESGSDFTYEAMVTVHSGAAGLTFRASADGADSDCVALDPAAGRVKYCINGPWWYGAAKEMALQYDRAYRLKVVARGASFEVYLDGVKLITTTSTRHASGRFGVLTCEGAATFDDIVATQ